MGVPVKIKANPGCQKGIIGTFSPGGFDGRVMMLITYHHNTREDLQRFCIVSVNSCTAAHVAATSMPRLLMSPPFPVTLLINSFRNCMKIARPLTNDLPSRGDHDNAVDFTRIAFVRLHTRLSFYRNPGLHLSRIDDFAFLTNNQFKAF